MIRPDISPRTQFGLSSPAAQVAIRELQIYPTSVNNQYSYQTTPMLYTLTTRHLTRTLPRTLPSTQTLRYFHPTLATMVKVGDPIPSVELMEASPGDKVDLSKELKGKGLIIGVPAAFSKLPAHNSSYVTPRQVTSLCCTRRDTCSASLADSRPGPSCSATHVPGYTNSAKLKDAGQVFVVSVNDPFVYVITSGIYDMLETDTDGVA